MVFIEIVEFLIYVFIKRQIRHPQYNTSTIVKYHDIGLVELDRSVLFTFYIWPACLYQGAGLSGETFDIAGFGLTEGL